jgi:hypothetical protein
VESCEPYHSPPATGPPSVARRMRDKRGVSLRYRTHFDGQGSELAAEELRFEVHRARFVPVFSIL